MDLRPALRCAAVTPTVTVPARAVTLGAARARAEHLGQIPPREQPAPSRASAGRSLIDGSSVPAHTGCTKSTNCRATTLVGIRGQSSWRIACEQGSSRTPSIRTSALDSSSAATRILTPWSAPGSKRSPRSELKAGMTGWSRSHSWSGFGSPVPYATMPPWIECHVGKPSVASPFACSAYRPSRAASSSTAGAVVDAQSRAASDAAASSCARPPAAQSHTIGDSRFARFRTIPMSMCPGPT